MKTIWLALHSALILLLVMWHWREPVPVASPYLIALVNVLPLLGCFYTLLRPTRNAIVFYLLLLLLYFMQAVVGSYDSKGNLFWPLTESVLVVANFCLALTVGRRLP